MSDIRQLLDGSKALEDVLRTGYGARGKGLTQLATSVRARIPDWAFQAVRVIANYRNRAAHDRNFVGDAYDSIPGTIVALCEHLLYDLKSNRPFTASESAPQARAVCRDGASPRRASPGEARISEIKRRSEELRKTITSDLNHWLDRSDIVAGDVFRKDYEFPDDEGVSEDLVSAAFLKKGWALKIKIPNLTASVSAARKKKLLKTVLISY